MPPRGRIVRDKPLRQTLAEVEEAQHCPEQKIQWIVSQIAFERILHCAVAYLILEKEMVCPAVNFGPIIYASVQGLNRDTPVAATSLVSRVTRVRLCWMAVAANNPSNTLTCT